MFFEINPNNIDSRLVTEAVRALKNGKIIIFPTDSVYAIGCDLNNKKALNQLAKFKGEKLNKRLDYIKMFKSGGGSLIERNPYNN